MSTLPTCQQCGGREFFIELGFYFCAECQIQSQDIREEVLTEYHAGKQVKTTLAKQPKPQQTNLTSKKEITSWEVFNFVLKGWVDELVGLGETSRLKQVALQLWVCYLQRLEVAFMSAVISKKPRLGFTHRARDAELVYGVGEGESRRLRKTFSGATSSQSSATSLSTSISRVASRKRKVLAEALYDEESAASETSRSNVSLDNLSTCSPASSTKSSKVCYTVDARERLRSLFEESCDGERERKADEYRRLYTQERRSLRHINPQHLFALLRLSMLVVDSRILPSDIFRWFREGYLSRLEKLLPANATCSKDIKASLVKPINSWHDVGKKVSYMARYLRVEGVRVNFLGICLKLARRLFLPEDIMEIMRKLVGLSHPNLALSATVNYEGRAVAFILFVLKLVFCLDGATEQHISTSATIINSVVKETKLFVWRDWVEGVELYESVLSLHHIPTRECFYPGQSGGEMSEHFIGQWSVQPKQQTLHRKHEVDPIVSNCLHRILAPLGCSGKEPLKPIRATPNSPCKPSSESQETKLLDEDESYMKQILSLDSITCEVKDRLKQLQFSSKSSSIATYFNTNRLKELAEQSDCQFQYGVAQEFSFVRKYRYRDIKPRSKHLHDMVQISLVGDTTDDSSGSDVTDSEDTGSKPGRGSRLCKPPPTKRKKLSAESVSSLSFTNHLRNKKGNLAQKVDLSELPVDEGEPSRILYVPDRQYWRIEGSFYNDALRVEEFEEYARTVFSPSFYWLLKQCSILVDQSMRDVYNQLLLVENVYLNFVAKNKKLSKNLLKKW